MVNSKDFLKRIRQVIAEVLRTLFRVLKNYISQIRYFLFWLGRVLIFPQVPVNQRVITSIRTFDVTLPLDTVSPNKLASLLTAAGYRVSKGCHCVFLGRISDIHKFCPGLESKNIDGFGLKIISSQAMSPDGTPYYTSARIAPASNWFSMRAVGSIYEKMVISNLLCRRGVAPHVREIVKLRAGLREHYALLVQNIPGSICHGSEAKAFMERFMESLEQYGLTTVTVRKHMDLQPPNYNNNIVTDGQHACYVDIQNFAFSKKHFISSLHHRFRAYSSNIAPYFTFLEQVLSEWPSQRLEKTIVVLHHRHSPILLKSMLDRGVYSCFALRSKDTALQELGEEFTLFHGYTNYSFYELIQDIPPDSESMIIICESLKLCREIAMIAGYNSLAGKAQETEMADEGNSGINLSVLMNVMLHKP